MAVNEVMSALSDETRRQILEILRKGKTNTGDLAELIGMTPQALSYHLRKLKQADLIYETRYKNFIYYELNLTVLDEAIVWINQIIGGKQNGTSKTNKKIYLYCIDVRTTRCGFSSSVVFTGDHCI